MAMREGPTEADRIRDATWALMRERDLLAELSFELHPPRLDEPARRRLTRSLESSAREIRCVVGASAGAELQRLVTIGSGALPSDDELRVVHAQLLSWLEVVIATLPEALVDAV